MVAVMTGKPPPMTSHKPDAHNQRTSTQSKLHTVNFNVTNQFEYSHANVRGALLTLTYQ